MKKILTHSSIFVFLFFVLACSNATSKAENTSASEQDSTQIRLEEKAKQALLFCKEKGYNTDYCMLIDMKIHSGKNRMFVWNFKTEVIDKEALCAHGSGKGDNKSTGAKPKFSNTEGSLLSALGKYKLGIRSYSQWGINVHYKMHGLEKTNNNAFKRIIVLHSHTPLPNFEIYPAHLPMGWSYGCPVTSNKMMTYLDEKLSTTKKPVLLWIYY